MGAFLGSGAMSDACADALAAAMLRELRARADGDGLPCAAKQVAIVALCLHGEGLTGEDALQAAARAFGALQGSTRGGLKKITSEARAVLQFGVPAGVPGISADEAAVDRLARFAAAVQAVSLRQVTQARALTLAGVRGGRPTEGGRGAYAAVQRLLRQAQEGDTQARTELRAIQELMVTSSRPAHTADRRAATR